MSHSVYTNNSIDPSIRAMSHILVSHLSKSFGNTHAVDDISLQVEAGEIYGLIGPDGAGKTTTYALVVWGSAA